MPWMWDFDNYGGKENKDMIGWFYPEDIENIMQIKALESEFNRKQAKKQSKGK